MGWLFAVVVKPWAALAFFGFACAVAFALRPLIPAGRVRDVLYDRTWRLRHPVAFKVLLVVGVYGMLGLMLWHFKTL